MSANRHGSRSRSRPPTSRPPPSRVSTRVPVPSLTPAEALVPLTERQRAGAVPSYSRLLNGQIGNAALPATVSEEEHALRNGESEVHTPVVQAAPLPPSGPDHEVHAPIVLAAPPPPGPDPARESTPPSVIVTDASIESIPDRLAASQGSILTVCPVPNNTEFENVLKDLEQIHGITWQRNRALIFAGLASGRNGGATVLCVVDAPDPALASTLVQLLDRSAEIHQSGTGWGKWVPERISIATSRTPLPLDAPGAVDSQNGYYELGTAMDIMSHGSADREIAPANNSTPLSELLKQQGLPPGTVCYVLYCFHRDAMAPASLPLSLMLETSETPAHEGSSSGASISNPSTSGHATPSPAETFLLSRFGDIYATQLALQGSQFGATYKNFHFTRHVFCICDALGMKARRRGRPEPYVEQGVTVTWEDVVDWLPGAIHSASFRNWRGRWALAQEVLGLLAAAYGKGTLTPAGMQDWQQLHSLVSVEPCTASPVPSSHILLAALSTDKYTAKLRRLKNDLTASHDVIVIDSDNDDEDYEDDGGHSS
ncbi:hypothetical protein C8R45DRAFT_1115239 [Mycena sanguinolenta]|nr:hypothetical protein C8R45DRAFT_1115239 [Mycena sanguinolenta]